MNFTNTWNYFFFNFSGFALVIKHNFIDEWVHLSLSGPRRTTTSSYICSSVFVTVLFSPLKSHFQSIAFRFWHFEHEINHLKRSFDFKRPDEGKAHLRYWPNWKQGLKIPKPSQYMVGKVYRNLTTVGSCHLEQFNLLIAGNCRS